MLKRQSIRKFKFFVRTQLILKVSNQVTMLIIFQTEKLSLHSHLLMLYHDRCIFYPAPDFCGFGHVRGDWVLTVLTLLYLTVRASSYF